MTVLVGIRRKSNGKSVAVAQCGCGKQVSLGLMVRTNGTLRCWHCVRKDINHGN